jgi:hypothetical protein
MEQDFKMPKFSKVILTAVFIGILGTLLTMAYDLYFVEELEFPLSSYINVSSIIFSVNLLFLAIGFIFYGFISSFKKGEMVFIILVAALTVLGIWKTESIHRTSDPAVNVQFRYLLSGIILIMGILASVLLPLLFHNRKFEKYFI